MRLNDIKFQLGEGGLGVQPAGLDHVSCLVYENITAPASWTKSFRSFRSLAQAQAAGIVDTNVNFTEVHYQIKEYFRQRTDGELYVGFVSSLDKNLFFSQTEGRVRQFGFFGDLNNAAAIQTLMDELFDLHAPAVSCVGYNTQLDENNLDDLYTKTFPKVDVLVVGDGGAGGEKIRQSLGVVCLPSVGTWLGATALANVHESTAWVDKFNLSDGAELEKVRLATGKLLEDTLVATQDELHDKGYTFIQKHTGRAGSYFNDNRTATSATSDYSSISNNRTIQKAIRGIRAALLGELSSPVEIDPENGQLSIAFIEDFKSKGEAPLFLMQADGELSGYELTIDPTQNVLATSTITVGVKLVPFGVARNILVNIGFATNIG